MNEISRGQWVKVGARKNSKSAAPCWSVFVRGLVDGGESYLKVNSVLGQYGTALQDDKLYFKIL